MNNMNMGKERSKRTSWNNNNNKTTRLKTFWQVTCQTCSCI